MTFNLKTVDREGRWDSTNEDESEWWPRVLWIDPGGVSGWAVVWFDPRAALAGNPIAKTVLAWDAGWLRGPELGREGQASQFLKMRKELNHTPGLATGVESFVIRQMNMSQEFLSPVRLRAMIEWRLSIEPSRLQSSTPSDAMRTFTDARLKELKMYTPGADHARDATRHCLLWIRKLQNHSKRIFESYHGQEEGWWEDGS